MEVIGLKFKQQSYVFYGWLRLSLHKINTKLIKGYLEETINNKNAKEHVGSKRCAACLFDVDMKIPTIIALNYLRNSFVQVSVVYGNKKVLIKLLFFFIILFENFTAFLKAISPKILSCLNTFLSPDL